MLSSMPLCFSVFGHLRAHRQAAVAILDDLLGIGVESLMDVDVRGRRLAGVECEWAPARQEHLEDRTAFDAVIAGRVTGGRSHLVAVEMKYVDSFSRDPSRPESDRRYEAACQEFGMTGGAFAALRGHATR